MPTWKITRKDQGTFLGRQVLGLHVPELKVYKKDWWQFSEVTHLLIRGTGEQLILERRVNREG